MARLLWRTGYGCDKSYAQEGQRSVHRGPCRGEGSESRHGDPVRSGVTAPGSADECRVRCCGELTARSAQRRHTPWPRESPGCEKGRHPQDGTIPTRASAAYHATRHGGPANRTTRARVKVPRRAILPNAPQRTALWQDATGSTRAGPRPVVGRARAGEKEPRSVAFAQSHRSTSGGA